MNVERQEGNAHVMLHITNGDSAAAMLRQTDIPGEVIEWSDVLHEGPTPGGLSPEDWRNMRAQFHASCGWGEFEGCLSRLVAMDEALARSLDHREIILWFEHDLFDQLILVRLLDWLAWHSSEQTNVSLICIGEFPCFENFYGLGQLNADQLATLYGTQHTVTSAEYELATKYWTAYCSPSPTEVESLLNSDTVALPFLRGALYRHLEQFPAICNGLSRTERQILEVLSRGPLKPAVLFCEEQNLEERVFMGDATFWRYVAGLSGGRQPLVEVEGIGVFSVPTGFGPYSREFLDQVIYITDRGREVLCERDDWVHIKGVDRWLGGVHLVGAELPWRWDQEQQRLVETCLRT